MFCITFAACAGILIFILSPLSFSLVLISASHIYLLFLQMYLANGRIAGKCIFIIPGNCYHYTLSKLFQSKPSSSQVFHSEHIRHLNVPAQMAYILLLAVVSSFDRFFAFCFSTPHCFYETILFLDVGFEFIPVSSLYCMFFQMFLCSLKHIVLHLF